ncbi:hypothetical protein GCM10023185_27980 [Hymenobacter saemangeumensis]|uniref:Outer membrane protein beta-barrel domain-containing protein n=1 Tax=Hymenobacter saemangeumensis TaxID=1084522 RepID=A0ABP8IKS0_9BACT
MKKILLFILLAAVSSPAAFAQARAGGELSSKDYTGGGTTQSRNTGFGVKGGYNLSGLRGDDIKGIDRNSRSDFHTGIYGQFGFNEFASAQLEALYSRQGFSANTGPNGSRQTYKMDYLSVPLMFVGNVTETLSFHVGPQVSLLVKAEEEGKDLDFDSNGLNSFDFGGVLGAEARVGPARVGARYVGSLGKIFGDNGAKVANLASGKFTNSDLYNNVFQLYIGIGFTQ